ncbi:MAG: LysE family transporter [Bacteroidales bacterium]|jgi:threonine/homoserine/homoserine lactone efflux protein|nr:LysE family transporter [Bacteroidales bacterium]
MTESLITISLVGFLAGFVFSMPVAGPISILITSNALKGKFRYCVRAAVGSAFADFTYVYIAVLGLTGFYSYYRPAIPYILMVGSIFLLFLGYKIFKTKLKIEDIRDEKINHDKYKNKGGFTSGLMLNFLNPTLFLGWLTSSFITISLVASLGFNMGGMDKVVSNNVKQINQINRTSDSSLSIATHQFDFLNNDLHAKKDTVKGYAFILSGFYAFFLSLGSVFWFYLLTKLLIKNRHRLNVNYLNKVISALGLVLCGFGIYLAGRGIDLVFFH